MNNELDKIFAEMYIQTHKAKSLHEELGNTIKKMSDLFVEYRQEVRKNKDNVVDITDEVIEKR